MINETFSAHKVGYPRIVRIETLLNGRVFDLLYTECPHLSIIGVPHHLTYGVFTNLLKKEDQDNFSAPKKKVKVSEMGVKKRISARYPKREWWQEMTTIKVAPSWCAHLWPVTLSTSDLNEKLRQKNFKTCLKLFSSWMCVVSRLHLGLKWVTEYNNFVIRHFTCDLAASLLDITEQVWVSKGKGVPKTTSTIMIRFHRGVLAKYRFRLDQKPISVNLPYTGE